MKLEKTIYLPDGDIRIITLKKSPPLPSLKRNERKAKAYIIRTEEKYLNDGSTPKKEYPTSFKPPQYTRTCDYTKYDVIDASKTQQQFILENALSKSDVGIVLYVLYRNSQSKNFREMLEYIQKNTTRSNKLRVIVDEVYELRRYYASRFLLRKRYIEWTGDNQI